MVGKYDSRVENKKSLIESQMAGYVQIRPVNRETVWVVVVSTIVIQ